MKIDINLEYNHNMDPYDRDEISNRKQRTVHIVTPCTRIFNLKSIAESINHNSDLALWSVKFKWYIVLDTNCLSIFDINQVLGNLDDLKIGDRYTMEPPIVLLNDKPGTVGHQHRNLVLDKLMNENAKGYFYSIDDDNIMHPHFWTIFEAPLLQDEYLNKLDFKDEDTPAIALTQVGKDEEVRFGDGGTYLHAKPEQMKLYHVDTAQVLFNLDYIGNHRYNVFAYNGDGIIVENFYNEYPNFVFIDKGLCYYNYLK